jgi:hypothetical protein
MWAPATSLRLPATLDRLRAAAAAIERHRRAVLAGIVVAQWGGVLAIALTARHNGWLYYHGGDGVWYWTTSWALGHFTLPATQIGFGLGALQSVGAAFLGPSLLSGLPFVVLLNALVLLPLVPLLVYGIGERLAGRLFGLFAAATWLVVPLLAYRMFRPDYRGQFREIFLPGAVGLNALGDFPSLVVCLAAVYFTLRAIDNAALTDAALAGTFAGFAIAVKPANALLLPAPLVGLVLARRFPQAAVFALGVVPAVVALAIWKQRGLGSLPLFGSAFGETRLAAPQLPLALGPDLSRYGGIDWNAIEGNLKQLREIFWSKTLAEWVVFAGAFALLRRSFAKGAIVVVWFAAFFLVKGGSEFASVYAGSFFRLIEPAYPAYVLLVAASAALLLPLGAGRRRVVPAAPPIGRRPVVVAVAVLSLAPLVLVATARPAGSASFAQFAGNSLDARIVDFGLQATAGGGAVRLDWRARTSRNAVVGYRIFRGASANEDCDLLGRGVEDCVMSSKPIANVSGGTTFVDRPGPGTWYYRVAQVASWDGKLEDGDPLLLSRPATAKLP